MDDKERGNSRVNFTQNNFAWVICLSHEYIFLKNYFFVGEIFIQKLERVF